MRPGSDGRANPQEAHLPPDPAQDPGVREHLHRACQTGTKGLMPLLHDRSKMGHSPGAFNGGSRKVGGQTGQRKHNFRSWGRWTGEEESSFESRITIFYAVDEKIEVLEKEAFNHPPPLLQSWIWTSKPRSWLVLRVMILVASSPWASRKMLGIFSMPQLCSSHGHTPLLPVCPCIIQFSFHNHLVRETEPRTLYPFHR